MASLGSLKSAVFHREERKMQYQSHIRGLNAYDRHKKFMNDYVQFYGNTKNVHNDMPIKTDQDTIREGYRFIISEDDDMDSTWEKRLVKRYYDKLFKEYCIADMSQYKMGKIGLRWRTEKEVISGKGQFICGNRACNEKESLGSYEVNFSYTEAGESKQALVKLVACKRCSEKLVYKRKKEKEHSPVREKEKYKRKRERSRDGDSTDDEYDKSTNRSRKGQKTSSSANDGRTDEDNFEEFLEGMFP
ncbi:protein FRA10AC1 homolog isoform X1 [Phoenix dactylifera]|uniref:Protein FRA10AC1 homolog isoform X1 n=1 Tax=Phoenix dactylifera TaxID=42345 RepID=A0A8B8ZQF6_PHODC|nr:protein FRA10AC1 homolog isoform X1 [Phoenix dactylifera]